MSTIRYRPLDVTPSLAFVLLCILLATVWFAGGASRADAVGQAVVRGAACGVLAVTALWGSRPDWRSAQAPSLFFLAALVLVIAQLVPLPQNVWLALPGRMILSQPSSITGEPQLWRAIAIVPDAGVNAAFSLVVPFAVLVLTFGLRGQEQRWVLGLLLLLIVLSTLVGLMQFSGVAFDRPFINDTPGAVDGGFANRNHFALFLAIGCLLAPVWAFPGGGRLRWRPAVAFGLVLLFVLMILATGSRTGILVGAVAAIIGILLVRIGLQREVRQAPRWILPTVLIGIVAIIAILVLLSVAFDRAASIQRLFTLDAAQDTRARALPTVLSMIATYFPAGSGFGGFDVVFRMHEPFHLLNPTYFNHAHNDLLEIALEGGLAGIILLGVAIIWWSIASVRAWRGGSIMARMGSAMLLLILLASTSDYPLRTPVMMAVVVLAAVWLGWRRNSSEHPTLPVND